MSEEKKIPQPEMRDPMVVKDFIERNLLSVGSKLRLSDNDVLKQIGKLIPEQKGKEFMNSSHIRTENGEVYLSASAINNLENVSAEFKEFLETTPLRNIPNTLNHDKEKEGWAEINKNFSIPQFPATKDGIAKALAYINAMGTLEGNAALAAEEAKIVLDRYLVVLTATGSSDSFLKDARFYVGNTIQTKEAMSSAGDVNNLIRHLLAHIKAKQ